jgi:hypothetical protein
MMHLQYVILFVAVMGLLIPAHAQTTSKSDTYDTIINGAKNCKKLIQDNTSITEAEKIVGKRLCGNLAASQIVGDTEIKNKRLYELRVKNLVQCETWYDNYKITNVETFKILKPRQLADDCISLYKDQLWNYKEKDRIQKILERADELNLFKIAKVKAELSMGYFPPTKQVEKGIPKTHVDCKNESVLIYKLITKKPSCVKIDSANVLIVRGWGSLFLNK